MRRNVALYPWYRFLAGLTFWQAVWFLYIQGELSAAEAILTYAIFDVATTMLEVPSGWLSDRWGRRRTLMIAALAGVATAGMQALGGPFWWFAAAQVLLAVQVAFVSGTDTSLLYESLAADGREAEVERHELGGWRAGFSALALSAIAGGALARFDVTWPYWATATAFAALLVLTWTFREPEKMVDDPTGPSRLILLSGAIRQPVLLWLSGLAIVMYAFSHVPFVFGQPFIERSLAGTDLASETPLVSGAITAAMMSVSLGVSLFAPALRRAVGLTAMLLGAFALQLALPGALAIATGPLAVLLLLSRMIPDALARPFLIARIQPLLPDGSRATYLSLQSLLGRLFFAATLWVAAGSTTEVGQMPEADVRLIMATYAIGGLFILLTLAVLSRRLPIERSAPSSG
ncbi:MFS transporter [Jannaschia donghaensis]|uniref:MFS transporter, sugar porter (SP) family n=1 Tax=Jannaschia donghaensis TaxID=420998 RepID=A0A0M6YG99_9RHOB|nr:MFS transporter [Jannaschia donghaensis]CTQ49382.1 MFS transporter, sugar porter (SP) family [Jannaschia donghaensis]